MLKFLVFLGAAVWSLNVSATTTTEVREALAKAADVAVSLTQAEADQQIPQISKVLLEQGQKKAAEAIERLRDPKVRELFAQRASTMLNETSQNGIVLLVDIIVFGLGYGVTFGGTYCLDNQWQDGLWCFVYLVAVVFSLDSMEIPVT